MKKRIWSFLLMLAVLQLLMGVAFAAQPFPDLSQNGSITLTMNMEGEKLDGGRLNLYRVGDLVRNPDGSYAFQPVKGLEKVNIDHESLNNPDLAQSVLSAAAESKLEYHTTSIINGEAVFSGLPVGLYLVWQKEADATPGYSAIQPFLISIPRMQDDGYVLDVVADPKVPLEPAPPETPPPSPPPRVPNTGQLNWPIPVMALAGTILFVFGWILWSGRKKTDYER